MQLLRRGFLFNVVFFSALAWFIYTYPRTSFAAYLTGQETFIAALRLLPGDYGAWVGMGLHQWFSGSHFISLVAGIANLLVISIFVVIQWFGRRG